MKQTPHSGKTKKQHPPWDFNSFRGRIRVSKQERLPPVYGVHPLRRNILSICYTTGESLLDFLKVIFAGNILSRFFHRLLDRSTLGVWHNAIVVSGRALIVQAGKIEPTLRCRPLNSINLGKVRYEMLIDVFVKIKVLWDMMSCLLKLLRFWRWRWNPPSNRQ